MTHSDSIWMIGQHVVHKELAQGTQPSIYYVSFFRVERTSLLDTSNYSFADPVSGDLKKTPAQTSL